MKKCSKCREIKEISEFNKKQKNIENDFRSHCKMCVREYEEKNKIIFTFRKHQYYQKNREKILKRQKEYNKNNKDYFKKYSKKRYLDNRKDLIDKVKKWRMDNQIKVLLWKEKNQQKIKDGQKLYFKKNKEKINNRRRYRFLFDVNYRLRTLLRCRLHKAIKRNVKQGSAIKDLGCSIPELKQKIEKMFQFGMNWNNWGYGKDKWHLDHIKSLSSFDLSDRIQFLKACHYSNLQPLWQLDNMKKG